MLSFIFKILYAMDLLIEGGIVMRIILNILKANNTNAFVNWIQDTTTIFITPFEGIVADYLKIGTLKIELTPVIALIFYIIIAFILSELIKAFSHQRLG